MNSAGDWGTKLGHQAGKPSNQAWCERPKTSGEYSGDR